MTSAAALSSALFFTATILLGSGVWLGLDMDGDGLRPSAEFAIGTDPTDGDSDGDGLEDGWELQRGLLPKDADQDRDGLLDGDDVRRGGKATSSDSDGDGIADADETASDCNGNGIRSIGDADDDSDARLDGSESGVTRCNPDVDGDGLLDGLERAELCVQTSDCDEDGLPDVLENGTTFDPLDPDSFDARLSDSVLWSFQERGQRPSGDDDHDGIPDTWETTAGLIEWGAFRPSAGRRDLLIEILRVSGPDSSRFNDIPFDSTYTMLANTFRDEAGITLSWVETRIRLDAEPRPPSIPSRLSQYYEDLLSRSVHATNPYVTTLVLNPQHDQSEILHLGVAPIRGMLAAVDYSAHSVYDFRGVRTEQQGNRILQTNITLRLTPWVESFVAADRQDAIQAIGFQSGSILPDGRYRLVAADYRLEWQPSWFRSAPLVTWNDGKTVQLSVSSRDVDEQVLASTVLHELGHTLGLCHLDLPDCYATLLPDEQPRLEESTMGPGHDSKVLHFFTSEWARVDDYLACPPDRPLVLIAQEANETDVLDEKYGYELEEILSVDLRRCGEFPSVPGARFEPSTSVVRYRPSTEDVDPDVPFESRLATVLYGVSLLLIATAAAFMADLRRP
jgi:hypothetical protein